MVTFPIGGEKRGNHPFAFEIENAYVQPETITRILKGVEGVSRVRERMLFRKPYEIHVEFKYLGMDFVVWEPFGDTTRYWIGPKHPTSSPVSIDQVEHAFRRYRPPFYRQVIGDLLSLGFVKRLVGP